MSPLKIASRSPSRRFSTVLQRLPAFILLRHRLWLFFRSHSASWKNADAAPRPQRVQQDFRFHRAAHHSAVGSLSGLLVGFFNMASASAALLAAVFLSHSRTDCLGHFCRSACPRGIWPKLPANCRGAFVYPVSSSALKNLLGPCVLAPALPLPVGPLQRLVVVLASGLLDAPSRLQCFSACPAGGCCPACSAGGSASRSSAGGCPWPAFAAFPKLELKQNQKMLIII